MWSFIGSVLGGLIAGWFVVVGVKVQFGRQCHAALRALMVEVTANKEAADRMNGDLRTSGKGFVLGNPDPSWLKHSIWDSQLPFVVQLFDEGTLAMVRYAYSLLESVPSMVNEKRALNDPRFNYGGWINTALEDIQRAFSDADRALENLSKRLIQEAWSNILQQLLRDFWRSLKSAWR